jgi:hypothetical protein
VQESTGASIRLGVHSVPPTIGAPDVLTASRELQPGRRPSIVRSGSGQVTSEQLGRLAKPVFAKLTRRSMSERTVRGRCATVSISEREMGSFLQCINRLFIRRKTTQRKRIVLLLMLRWRTQTDINVTGTLDSHHMMPPAARVSARVFGTRARPIPPGGQANLLPFRGCIFIQPVSCSIIITPLLPFHYPSTALGFPDSIARWG